MDVTSLKYKYASLSIAEKLIAINVLIFIFHSLFVFFMQVPPHSSTSWVELPENVLDYIVQPWSIVTYSFFHSGIGHVFFNMILLYFSGRIFLNLYKGRQFLNVYFMGVILGGLLYMLAYNIFPVFFGTNSILIGASAGVMAVLIFICTALPNQEVSLILFNVKLWHIGVFFVVLDLVMLPNGNSGGRIAHIGGALLGYVYAKQLYKGNDIGEWFAKIGDAIVAVFKSKKNKPLKTVYKKSASTKKAQTKAKVSKDEHQKKIDSILDKISKSGYESLSKVEKDFLFQAGKK